MLSTIAKTLFAAQVRHLDDDDSSDLKIGVLSDLHLNLRYDEGFGPRTDGNEGDCWAKSGTKTDIKAPMGRYGCDPPQALIDTMLDAFNDHHGEQDVIFLTGDLNAHHVAMDAELYPEGKSTYELLLRQHKEIVQGLAKKFPDTPILPAFGNNDNKYHDNPQPLEDDQEFYSYIYDLWFE